MIHLFVLNAWVLEGDFGCGVGGDNRTMSTHFTVASAVGCLHVLSAWVARLSPTRYIFTMGELTCLRHEWTQARKIHTLEMLAATCEIQCDMVFNDWYSQQQRAPWTRPMARWPCTLALFVSWFPCFSSCKRRTNGEYQFSVIPP